MFRGALQPLVLATVVAGAPAMAAPLVEIGRTVQVRNAVVAEYEADRRRLDRGDLVHQNEVVETSRASLAEIRLLDDTKLAVGPESRLTLDTFVYNARANPGTTAVTMAKGAFRFISGNNPSSTYQVITPAAAIGVRGTVFDLWVNRWGDTLGLLHVGAIEVCPTPTNCRLFDTVGGLIHISAQGEITYPQRYQNRAMRDIPVETAFPFVGRPLSIDPTPRLRHAILLRNLPRPRDAGRYPSGPTKTGYPSPGSNPKQGYTSTGQGTKGSTASTGNTSTTTKTGQTTTRKTYVAKTKQVQVQKTTIQKNPQLTLKPRYKQIYVPQQKPKTIIK
jgi:hypothetical protein